VEVLDVLDENIHGNQQTRATGFVGKSSEIRWLRVALSQTEEPEDESGGTLSQRRGSYVPGNDLIRTFSYWADSEQIDIPFAGNVEELPSPDVAERLLQCYIQKVQESFPIFPRRTFEDRFWRYFEAVRNGRPFALGTRWQAILNLVFAIGAKYSHLTKTDLRVDECDHLIYLARATSLGLNEETITNPSDLQQIQGLGLLAFYWMISGQVSRAWTSVGLAVRCAYALGLHVRNEDLSATAVTKEALGRTLWSLHWLETTLSTMTGRPSSIIDSRCSVSLPVPVPEEGVADSIEHTHWVQQRSDSLGTPLLAFSSSSSLSLDSGRPPIGLVRFEANSGSYFRAIVQLSIITQSILTTLYPAGTLTQTSEDIEEDVSQIGRDLEKWLHSLPMGFSLQQSPSGSHEPFVRERTLLMFRFCSAKMLLTRPCLVGRRQSWREVNKNSSTTRSTDACVDAAKTIVGILPDEPQSDMIREHGPWWSITHHMMQAFSILLLALSCPSVTSQDDLSTLQCAKKVIRWLQTMQNPMAVRAYHIALNALEAIGRRHGFDVSDLWSPRTGEVMYAGSHVQHPVLDAYMATSLPPHVMSMSTAGNADASMASYASYDTVMADTTFPSYYGALQFNNSYYVGGQ